MLLSIKALLVRSLIDQAGRAVDGGADARNGRGVQIDEQGREAGSVFRTGGAASRRAPSGGWRPRRYP
jgi:hypothetical protein